MKTNVRSSVPLFLLTILALLFAGIRDASAEESKHQLPLWQIMSRDSTNSPAEAWLSQRIKEAMEKPERTAWDDGDFYTTQVAYHYLNCDVATLTVAEWNLGGYRILLQPRIEATYPVANNNCGDKYEIYISLRFERLRKLMAGL